MIVEFALVTPVFLLMLLGAFELGHATYVQSALYGALQEAGRDAGLESGSANLSQIDAAVLEKVKYLTPQGAIVATRKNYSNFEDVGTPEDFIDKNGNLSYDAGECFTDVNGNNMWDTDRGGTGLGGADDVVAYTAALTYKRIFPLGKLLGWSDTTTISATTISRNQPYGDQAERSEVQVCPA